MTKNINTIFNEPTGQRFLHYAYSWGAAIVILGALFKLTHLPFADLLLYIGMGTEVFVFFLTGFDIPGYRKGMANINTSTVLPDMDDFSKQITEAVAKGVENGMAQISSNISGSGYADEERKRVDVAIREVAEKELEEMKTTLTRTEDINFEAKRLVGNLNEINSVCRRVADTLKGN